MSCEKEPFTYQGALDALTAVKVKWVIRHQQRRRECRVYACRECGCWHLTSSPGRTEETA
jgi:hypothetical protein